MAHKKGQGSTSNGRDSIGKRLSDIVDMLSRPSSSKMTRMAAC